MKQTIMLDLDDTLIHCNKYFWEVVERFSEQMETWFSPYGIKTEDIRQKQAQLDIAYVQKEGFLISHFPQSLVDTYLYFSAETGRDVSEQEKQTLFEWGQTVFSRNYEPYPHMEETLEGLIGDGHKLCLYTGGDRQVQRDKIRQLELERYFGSNVFITRHKNEAVLEQILTEQGFDKENTWMIGNSLKTDVLPALKAKIHSIYIPADREWSYNLTDIDVKPQRAFLTLKQLKEVPPAIRNFIS